MAHVNTFNRVLVELASHNINFDEEVKALSLLSSLQTSWDGFYMTVTKGSSKLTLDDTRGLVLPKELRRKSMGLSLEETTEAHYSEETSTFERAQNHTRGGRASSRSRGKSPNAFYTYCKKSGHQTMDYWSLARKNKGKRSDRNASFSISEQRRTKVNLIAAAPSREILFRQLLYQKSFVQCERCTNMAYSLVRDMVHILFSKCQLSPIGQVQECGTSGIENIPLRQPKGNTITLQQLRHVPKLKRGLILIGILVKWVPDDIQ